MRRLAALGLVLAFLFAGAVQAADIAFPPLTGRVVDQVGVLDGQAKQQLTQVLSDHEARTGQQVVVAIVSSLQGQTIEDYGYQLGRFWGIGQKDKDTGAILLVAPAERKVSIEVGYGLEGQLTDAKSADIVQGIILPAFKQGQMSAGIVAGAQAMLRVLGDQASATQSVTEQSSAARPSMASQEIAASSPHQLFGAGLFILFWIILMIISLRRRSGFFFLPLGLGGQSWGGGGGGFSGGFSGGGGSFGGGGASGSW